MYRKFLRFTIVIGIIAGIWRLTLAILDYSAKKRARSKFLLPYIKRVDLESLGQSWSGHQLNGLITNDHPHIDHLYTFDFLYHLEWRRIITEIGDTQGDLLQAEWKLTPEGRALITSI